MPIVLEGIPSGSAGTFAIVVSRFNRAVTTRLLEGAVGVLSEHGVASEQIVVAWVPGAWEIPVVADRLAQSPNCAAVICLGAIIRGQTGHHQFIADQLACSLGRIALERQVPVSCGILTCETLEQAMERSGGSHGNQGAHCARAALEMADLMARLATRERPDR